MGCTNSPSMFSRLMSMVLKGLTWVSCVVFIDDTVVIARSFSEMVSNLEQVLDRFRSSNLKLKPSKCKLFQRRVKTLGHVVSSEGYEPDPDKINCIEAWEFPRSITELRKFIGLASYYRSFCPNFSIVAEPLTEMLRKGVSIQRTERRQEAFNKLKQFLTTAPVLAMPNDDDEYVLDVDGSMTGAGAVLQQYQNGHFRVIEYASRTFNKHERRYCVTRLELAALIFGLRQFKTYLLGRKFTVRCDHMALKYYSQTKEPVGQQARHLDFIAQFDFEIKFREGRTHVNADALSRLRLCEVLDGEPCKQCNKRVTGRHHDLRNVCGVQTRAQRQLSYGSGCRSHCGNCHECTEDITAKINNANFTQSADMPINSDTPPSGRMTRSTTERNAPPDGQNDLATATATTTGGQQRNQRGARSRHKLVGIMGHTAPHAVAAGATDWTPAYLAELQAQDNDIGPAVKWLSDGVRPDWSAIKALSPALRALWRQFESLVLRQGVLCRIFHNFDGSVGHYQLVLPSSLKVSFLEMVHADAAVHLKFVKCINHVQRRAWYLASRFEVIH